MNRDWRGSGPGGTGQVDLELGLKWRTRILGSPESMEVRESMKDWETGLSETSNLSEFLGCAT